VNVTKPHFRDWQERDARLVKALVRNGDVYAFAYSQEVPVEQVASGSSLGANVRALREMGYTEIVLIGHSAGGLVAREFVEDHPDAGVTRVIQVCAPNGGSTWAKLPAVRKNQLPFIHSMTKDARRKVIAARQDRHIPGEVEFVCVVGTGAPGGDGVVAREAQWSDDLQRQGIPAVAVDVTHASAMRSAKAVDMITKLVLKDLQRWDTIKVTEARKVILAN
jgi:pimeloyl-ACP methyl ester carboxylesterase